MALFVLNGAFAPDPVRLRWNLYGKGARDLPPFTTNHPALRVAVLAKFL
jgi:hypothetical protein